MKIHKGFCEELGKLRRSTVGDIIVSLGIVELNAQNISNLKAGIPQLEQIFYTVDYLKNNELVQQESHQIGEYVPDFDPTDFIKDNTDRYSVAQMNAMPGFLQDYWGIGLIVNPVYSVFVSNGFKTDEEADKAWNKWSPYCVAIVAALATAILTAIFT